jgi:hypothetical protein|tara:strand:- start:775 stop:1647 length:873 start_codon:yes stop_codon:yes gene_type:complete
MKNDFNNPNETFFDGVFPEEDVYQIEKFFDDKEVSFLVDWYYKNKNKEGWHILNGDLSYIENGHIYDEVLEILFPKLTKHFGKFKLYNQINNDKHPHSADFFIEQNKIFAPHTDSITHIPKWLTQKDIVIPLWIENDAEVYTYNFNQRCYRRSTHFRKGSKDVGLNVYSNALRGSYDIDGVKYLNGTEIDHDFIENHIGDAVLTSHFEGMTVKSLEKNIPGNAIIKDSSIIHGPSNYHLKGSGKKLNISIRLFKEVEDWNPDTTFSVRSFEESRNKRTYYNDKKIKITKD